MSVARTDVVIIGAGQAGLAMSRCLSDLGIEHVVLERGRVGAAVAQPRLGLAAAADAELDDASAGVSVQRRRSGRLHVGRGAGRVSRSAMRTRRARRSCRDTTVQRVDARGARLSRRRPTAACGRRGRSSSPPGYCDRPSMPAMGAALASSDSADRSGGVPAIRISCLLAACSSSAPRRPGCSWPTRSSDRAGRSTLAVGRHTRLPRRYRGRDILWWLDRLGALCASADTCTTSTVSRHQPSLQLVGRPDHASLDLDVLHKRGVRLTGRVARHRRHRTSISTTISSRRRRRPTSRWPKRSARIDAIHRGHAASRPDAARAVRARRGRWRSARARRAGPAAPSGIATVIWATGYRRVYPWLRVPVLDAGGEIIHDGGVTAGAGAVRARPQFSASPQLQLHRRRRRRRARDLPSRSPPCRLQRSA